MPSTAGKKRDGKKYDFNRDHHNLQTTFGLAYDSIADNTSVLDIGCATGNIIEILRDKKHCEVEGIEIEGSAVEIAREKGLTVHHLNLEDDFLTWNPGKKYDYILLLDVIEHLLPYPEAPLKKIQSLLKDTGTLILSTPNIAHIDAVTRMINGDLSYTERGIFDKTHLHFYMPHELLPFGLECGLVCNSIRNIYVPQGKTELAADTPIFEQTSRDISPLFSERTKEVYQYLYFFRNRNLSKDIPFDQYIASLGLPTSSVQDPIEPKLWNIIVRYHKDCIDQLADALYSIAGQSYPKIQVVLVGHTSDGKLHKKVGSLVEKFKGLLSIEHVTANPKKKRGHPLNIGLDHCKGTYVSFLDYDDRYYPHFGELLINAIKNDSANFAFGTSIRTNQKSENDHYKTVSKTRTDHTTFNPVYFVTNNYLPINSFVFDRSVFTDIRFDENLDVLEDWDYLLQLLFSQNLKVTFVNSTVSEYYVRDDNTNSPVYDYQSNGRMPAESIHARKHIPAKYIGKTFPVLYQDAFDIYPDCNELLNTPLDKSDIGQLEIEKCTLHQEIKRLDHELTMIKARKGYWLYTKLLKLMGRSIPV